MQTDAVATRYAQALLDLAADSKNIDKFATVLEEFTSGYEQSSELRVVLTNPAIPAAERHAVIATIGKKLKADTHLINFLKLLVDRGRIVALPGIARAYQRLADAKSGRVRAIAKSARKLTAAQVKQVQKATSTMLDCEVLLDEQVDESLLGGIRLEIQGRVYDGSVRGQLNKIREQLTG